MPSAQIEKWNQRYREGHDDLPVPLSFFVDLISRLRPGRALDLACGTGRHSLWLAERGWSVVAIDGSEVAVERLRGRSPLIEVRQADIEQPEFAIPDAPYDLIVDTFFLHRPLFGAIREALRGGGMAVFALHLTGSFAIEPGELYQEFADWPVVHQVIHDQIPTIELAVLKP